MSSLATPTVSHASDAAAEPAPREAVATLHGLNGGPWTLAPLARRLERAGYRVHRLRYRTHLSSLDEAVAAIDAQCRRCGAATAPRLHFVGNSLGALVLRAYLSERRPPNLGRVVLVAPPNRGSEIVDAIGDWPLFRALFGPLAGQLGTDGEALPQRLPVPDCEIGVLAGSRWVNPLGQLLLPSPHDGTISVASTRLPRMRDHRVLPYSHPFLARSRRAAEEILHFLREGRFAAART